MAEATICSGISGTDISALKRALLDQQQLLQKLHAELDVEREASATAASEALAMILRLQGEKAAVEMEASQYKRMAEEKMCHAEHSLEIFEELIYHKEMEIASLDFQVQAYRYKLLSLGWTDVGFNENRFPENRFPHRCDLSNGDMGFDQNPRRMSSLPAIWWTDAYQKKGIFKSNSVVPPSEAVPIIEECFDLETSPETFDLDKKYSNYSTTGDFDSYWEQIRKLDDRVKEISQSNGHPREDRSIDSYSFSSSTNVPVNCSCATRRESTVVSDEIKCYQNDPDNSSCSNVVQDIFEVPQNEERYKTRVKERSKSISKADSETLGSHSKDQSEWIKKMLSSLNLEAKPPRPRENKKEIDSAESQSGLQQLHQRIKRLEKDRTNQGKSEIVREGLGEQELNLLKEIREQLNSIQDKMRCRRRKKAPLLDETPVNTVMEDHSMDLPRTYDGRLCNKAISFRNSGGVLMQFGAQHERNSMLLDTD
ncbi:hypothetical protein CDL15_Pgr015268 [Punica granatum]|uniref:GTD-binding domain-containing protein n=1 Tax=Punica granatum TaxID=22663 RepID=A0A218VZW6_PUNGR|nr:hypothetical protein CDL15_Pgr015268 [Punica granatum]